VATAAAARVATTSEEVATARVVAATRAAAGSAATMRPVAARLRAAVAMGCGDWSATPRQ
jgi:hypothetical protein